MTELYAKVFPKNVGEDQKMAEKEIPGILEEVESGVILDTVVTCD